MKDLLDILINRYKSLTLQIKVSFWFAFSNIVSNGITYLTLPIFTRILSTKDYGLVTIFNSWNSIAMIFLTLNLSSGVFLTAYSKNKADGDRLISSFQGLITTIGSFFLIIYIFLRQYVNKILGLNTMLVLLLFIECTLTASYDMWAMKLKYKFKYKILVFLTILTSVLNPILGVIFIVNFQSGGIAKIVSSAIVKVLLFGWIYIWNIINGRCFFDRGYWKYALGFGIPLVPHYLSLVILNQSDRLMISSLCGESKAGIYGVGYNISYIVNLIFSGVNTAFGPWIMQKINDREYDIINRKTSQLLIFILTMCLFIVTIEPELLKIVTTSDYYEAMWVMPSVTLGLFFSYLNNLFARVEFYYEKKYHIAMFSIGSAIINILLNLIFIPRFGMIAAGYTTLFSYMILSALHFILYKMIAKNKMDSVHVFNEKLIFIMGISAVVVSILMTMLIDYPRARYMIVTIIFIFVILCRKRVLDIFKIGRS